MQTQEQSKTTIGLGLSLTAGKWETPPVHIPDEKGMTYKTELVLQRVPHVEKINWWHQPDPRREPHSHPWPFRSTILSGGYTETRWTLIDGVWTKSTHSYKEGDVNDMLAGTFHTVDEVLPKTTTHMVCGELVPDGFWGYLNPETGEIKAAEKDPTFLERLWGINPHMRKK